jgi:hypothetical protein
MKKIIKPSQKSESVYYSDFSGKLFDNNFGSPVTLKMKFNYGSKYDGSKLKLDLDDEDAILILNFLREKLQEESKKEKLNFI